MITKTLYIVHSETGIHLVTFDKDKANKAKGDPFEFITPGRMEVRRIHTETVRIEC